MEVTICTPEGTQIAHFTSLAALIWMWLHTKFPDLDVEYLDKCQVEVKGSPPDAASKLTMGELLEVKT